MHFIQGGSGMSLPPMHEVGITLIPTLLYRRRPNPRRVLRQVRHFFKPHHSPSHLNSIMSTLLVRFPSQASSLGVDPEGLYNALLADAENLPPNWDLQGRQVDAWIKYGAFPYSHLYAEHMGWNDRRSIYANESGLCCVVM